MLTLVRIRTNTDEWTEHRQTDRQTHRHRVIKPVLRTLNVRFNQTYKVFIGSQVMT
jgi:hypothetical protein